MLEAHSMLQATSAFHSPLFHSLYLQNLNLKIHLGCEAWERELAQEVQVNIEFRFSVAPLGFHSDILSETICYAEVSQKIVEHCECREYHLIEKVSADIYALAHDCAGARAQVAVTVHKLKPPIEKLSGGTRYRCGDFS